MLIPVIVCMFTAGWVGASGVDITTPGDPVIGVPNDGNWPTAETPPKAIDNNTATKFLHRSSPGSGLVVSPQLGTGTSQPTLVQGISLSTGNDHAERDPRSYELYGSNGSAEIGPWTLISDGPVVDFLNGTWPRKTQNATPIIFDNQIEYLHYRLVFPTLGVSTIMAVSEIELLTPPASGWEPVVSLQTASPQVIDAWSNPMLQLNATIDDFDSTSWDVLWSMVSGPAAVDFNGTENDLDAAVTFSPVKGLYVLQLDVTDDSGNKAVPKRVTVRVWDSMIDNAMIAHWTFNEGSGSVVNDSVENNCGYLGSYQGMYQDPNFVTGWIPAEGVNNYALQFTNRGYVQVLPDPNSVSDPNLMNLDAGLSVAAWVNATDWVGNHRIVQFGNETNDNDNIFRLLYESNTVPAGLRFIPSPARDRMVSVPPFSPGEWHHVAGTYDGKTVKLYFDGALVGVQEYATYRFLNPYSGQKLYIGSKNSNTSNEGDYMKGALDDVRVYSYAIDMETVQSLVQMGQNSAPVILGINAPAVVVLRGETTVVFSADVYDAQNDALYTWTQVTPDPLVGPNVVISSANAAAPEVTFSEGGSYTFRLTISDGMYTDEQTFTVSAVEADCALVKADGLIIVGDLNEDCRVDIKDFAVIASHWLACNDPQDPTCDDPYAL